MTTARGDVRSRVEFEGAGDSARGLQAIETQLKGMAKAGDQSANALQRIGAAFTPIRRNLEVVNQIRGAFNMGVQAIRSTLQAINDLAQRTPRTKTELDRLKTTTGQLADEFVRGLDTGRRFSGMFSELSGGMAGAADGARTLGAGISGLISGLGELNRIVGAAQTGGLTVLLQALRDAAMSGTRNVERYLGEGGPVAEVGLTSPQAVEDLPRPGSGRGDQGAGSRRWNDQPTRRRSGRGGGARTSLAEQLAAADTTSFMADATDRLSQAQAELWAQAEAEAEFMAGALEELFGAQEELAGQRLDKANEVHEAELEHHRQRIEMVRELRQAEEEAAEKARQQDIERHERITTTFEGLSGVASGLEGILQTVADAEDERGKKADSWRKAVGVAKGTLYAIEAVAAAAQMGMAIAEQNYLGAVAAGEAMVNYGIASGYMFSKLAGTGGGGVTAASSAGTFTPTRPQTETPAKQVTDERPIVVLGIGNTDAGVAAAMARANDQLLRSGLTPLRGSTGVGYQG